MLTKKWKAVSAATFFLIAGVSAGTMATAIADNKEIKVTNNVIMEEHKNLPDSTVPETSDNPIKLSYVNYSKDKINEIIKLYAILENCQFKNSQKDEFIYYLSEYVTSSVQAEKFTAQDLKNEYISYAMSFQPPHPTNDDCIESYQDAKEVVNYWNEKKNTAFNELFSSAKNRYSAAPDDNIDTIQEVIELPNNGIEQGAQLNLNSSSFIHDSNSNDNAYSLTTKKLPWEIKRKDIFNSDSIDKKHSVETNENLIEIIPDKKENINKMAIISDKQSHNETKKDTEKK